jgi:hypothetical protein
MASFYTEFIPLSAISVTAMVYTSNSEKKKGWISEHEAPFSHGFIRT